MLVIISLFIISLLAGCIALVAMCYNAGAPTDDQDD